MENSEDSWTGFLTARFGTKLGSDIDVSWRQGLSRLDLSASPSFRGKEEPPGLRRSTDEVCEHEGGCHPSTTRGVEVAL